MSHGANRTRYLEMQIAGQPKEWLVPLLYEHLLSHLRRAAAQIADGDTEGRSNSLRRASAIILELAGTLDSVAGGEIANRLAALYAFLGGELLEIGRTQDVERLRRITGIVEDLYGAWVAAAESVSPRTRPGAETTPQHNVNR